jgi:predicted phosphodiesterase
MDKALIIPDCHFPYVDFKAWSLCLEVASTQKISEVVILGDFGDFYSVSSHKKDPRLATMLETEVVAINDALTQIDELFPQANKIYIEGNHEYRLERYLQDQAPALFGMIDCETLFNLNERINWKWIPYGPSQKYAVLGSKLWARHEPFSMSSPQATARKALCSLVYGHKHTREFAHIVGMDGQDHIVYSPGYLGGHRVFPKIYGYVKSHHQWQLGFDIVSVDHDTKYFYTNPVQILDNYTCVYGGKRFKA